MAAIQSRKSAVQQLQEQLQKEIDDKEAEFSAFKEKTKRYVDQLKKKHEEELQRVHGENETLQQQIARQADAHAQEIEALEKAHQRELAARENSQSTAAFTALEVEKDAAVKALKEAQTRLRAAQEAAAQIHVLKGELEEERKVKEAAQKEIARVRSTAAASPNESDPVAAIPSFLSPGILTGTATPKQLSSAFSGFAGFSGLSTALAGGDPSTSLFGSSSGDASTSIFGSSALKPEEVADGESPDAKKSAAQHQHGARDVQDTMLAHGSTPGSDAGKADEGAVRQAREDAQKAKEEVVALKEKLRVSLQKAVDVKKSLEAEKTELAQQLSTLQAEMASLLEKQGQTAIMPGKSEELEQAETRIKLLEAESDAREKTIRTQMERIELLQNETQQMRSEIELVMAARAEAETGMEEARKQVEASKEQAREMLKKAVEAKKQLQAKVEELADENSKMRASIKDGAGRCAVGHERGSAGGDDAEDAWLQIKMLTEQLSESREQTEVVSGRLQEMLESKQEAVSTLSANAVLLTKERDALRLALDKKGTYEAQSAHCMGDHVNLETPEKNGSLLEGEQPRAQQAESAEEVDRLQGQLRASKEEIMRLSEELSASKREAEELRCATETAAKDTEDARKQIAALQGQAKRAHDEEESSKGGSACILQELQVKLEATEAQLEIARQETAGAREAGEKQVAEAKEQAREMLKKAVEAKKQLQARLQALNDENLSLREQSTKEATEEPMVKALRSELDACRAQVDEMTRRLQEVLESKEVQVQTLQADIVRLEAECARGNKELSSATQFTVEMQEKIRDLQNQVDLADKKAQSESRRAEQAAAEANESHERSTARLDELCRKLNQAEQAAVDARRTVETEAASAMRERQELQLEVDAAREAAEECEALRGQVVTQARELAALQHKLLAAETEAEAGAKMRDAGIESVKEKSKQYMKKAIEQQKVLQGRVRELEEELQLARVERERVDEVLKQAQNTDVEVVAAREARDAAQAQLADVSAEFERYKMRAHTLLKKTEENGGTGGRDVTGTLEDMTRELAGRDTAIKGLREEVLQLEKQRSAHEREARDREDELSALRKEFEALENAWAADRRVMQLKIETLQKASADVENARNALSFLSHALELEMNSLSMRLEGAEKALAAASVSLPLLQSQFVDSQMQVRDLQRRYEKRPAEGSICVFSNRNLLAHDSPQPRVGGSTSVGAAAGGGKGSMGSLMDDVSPFHAHSRMAVSGAGTAEGIAGVRGREDVYSETNESKQLADLLLGGGDGVGVGMQGKGEEGSVGSRVRVAGDLSEEVQRVQQEVQQARAQVQQEQQASQIYVARMKEELANAISDRDKLARDNAVIKQHLRESEQARERSEKVQEIEYVKNCVVKYLESNDEKVLPLVFKALHLGEHDIARIQMAQGKGFFGWLARNDH